LKIPADRSSSTIATAVLAYLVASSKTNSAERPTYVSPGVAPVEYVARAEPRAGFDVLTFDKRGRGISGGYNDINTLEQGRDMWRALGGLETGDGVRALSSSGELIKGATVRGKFLAGMKAKEISVIFGGSSQGSIATTWAMHQNFVADQGAGQK
jgi:hypothetical protein